MSSPWEIDDEMAKKVDAVKSNTHDEGIDFGRIEEFGILVDQAVINIAEKDNFAEIYKSMVTFMDDYFGDSSVGTMTVYAHVVMFLLLINLRKTFKKAEVAELLKIEYDVLHDQLDLLEEVETLINKKKNGK
jgi:hypothetical protein